MAFPKISNMSLGIIIVADLAATGSNIVLPILGEVGVGALAGIAVFASELLLHKNSIINSIIFGAVAAFLIAIPGPVGAIGGAAYLLFGKKVG